MLAGGHRPDQPAPEVEKTAARILRLSEDVSRKGSGHRSHRHTRSLARFANDCRRRIGSGCLCPKAHQRRRAGRRSHDRRGAQDRARRAGRHVQRKSTPHLIEAKKQVVDAGLLGQSRPRRSLLLLSHAGQRESTRATCSGFSRLRTCGPGRLLASSLRSVSPPAVVAYFHGIRQRHRGRYVRAHVRHHALDARPRLAETSQASRGRDFRR